MKSILKTSNILNNSLFTQGERLLATCSGGIDSSVLLYCLNQIKVEFDLTIIVCHLNHNLRGAESERDERFVKNFSQEYGFPFYSKKLTKIELEDVDGDSLQQFLRNKRYEFFSELCSKNKLSKIVTAHNSDDVVETFLMRILKGTSLKGLTSIKEERTNIIRPLLHVSRKEIEQYGKQNKIDFVEDSSNKSDKYLRNSVRLNLIPYIEKNFNESIKETVLRTVSNLEADDDYMSEQTLKLIKRSQLDSNRGEMVFDRKKLLYANKALKLRLFFKITGELIGSSDVVTKHGLDFLELIKGSEGTNFLMLPGGLKVVRAYDNVHFTTCNPLLSNKDFSEEVVIPSKNSFFNQGFAFEFKILKSKPRNLKCVDTNSAFFDYGKFSKNVSLRYFKDGDTIKPLGMSGNKKIKNIFIDEKISLIDRRRVPLLCSGKKVVWISGVKLSDDFKVTANTKEFLKVTYKRLD